MKDFTIIISHAEDITYLDHNLDIMDQLGFSRSQIWIDGYFCRGNKLNGTVSKITSHECPHGERSYDLLMNSNTEFVIIMDSDFLCADPYFWKDAIAKIRCNPIVSIKKPWHLSINMLTTPFVGYQRKAALEMLPVKKAWNHFSLAIPGLSNVVFDHLCFLFFTAMCIDRYSAIDSWVLKDRIFKFCHLWDSRHNYDENFKEFEKLQDATNYVYLAHGISKYIFHYVAGKIPKIEDKIWEYVKKLKDYNIACYNDQYPWKFFDKYPFGYLLDVISNLESVIYFKLDWVSRFKPIEAKFNKIMND